MFILSCSLITVVVLPNAVASAAVFTGACQGTSTYWTVQRGASCRIGRATLTVTRTPTTPVYLRAKATVVNNQALNTREKENFQTGIFCVDSLGHEPSYDANSPTSVGGSTNEWNGMGKVSLYPRVLFQFPPGTWTCELRVTNVLDDGSGHTLYVSKAAGDVYSPPLISDTRQGGQAHVGDWSGTQCNAANDSQYNKVDCIPQGTVYPARVHQVTPALGTGAALIPLGAATGCVDGALVCAVSITNFTTCAFSSDSVTPRGILNGCPTFQKINADRISFHLWMWYTPASGGTGMCQFTESTWTGPVTFHMHHYTVSQNASLPPPQTGCSRNVMAKVDVENPNGNPWVKITGTKNGSTWISYYFGPSNS